MSAYAGSVIFVFILGGIVFYMAMQRRIIQGFSLQEIVTIALFCSLLYIATVPFKFGLSRIPFIQALIFSIPVTAVLVVGIRLVPKCGTATLIIFGNSLLSQIISRGINPLWWPYALLAGFVLELYFLISRNYLETKINALGAGLLHTFVVYVYFYFFSAPFLWHLHYASWYWCLQTIQGIACSGAGALIGFAISRPILSAYRHGGV